ncbi:hypothetical protein CCHL11_00458 [Colletotrichum chlorophyti]|uniref:DUF7053 domain-containing protein n=1 Tax=Colletotrichum chlorophyti TaxID=708187 RepID=A0A1Q8RUJ4_9PEZI|nr:hypothetical protein CCHL11_00458 [Colletotrichum chlorophyti]
MSKRTTFTTISPLPAGISREAVLEFLHNHIEMIDLNPLIKERHLIKPPAHAPPEEHACTWYSLTDEISYLPGGLATGDISYTCCFHNLPTGLQTHCYAPMGLDIRDKWTVAGSMPGEPIEPVELGIGAPLTGLYIREDVDMRCNVFTTSFVKKTLKKSHGLLVDRLKSKIREASVLAAHQHPGKTTPDLYQQLHHQRHGSQMSFSGSDMSRPGVRISSQPPPQQNHHNTTCNSSLGSEFSLPYRPSYPNSVVAPTTDGPNPAYAEPPRAVHMSNDTPTCLTIRSPPSAFNSYTHANKPGSVNDTYDVKPTPSSYAGAMLDGDPKLRAGRQPAASIVAELE